ncbi:MAG: cupin domain-containing protein [candidate division NC10 bacterium]|jgi:quercetin dioxygenase-like cupin family protein
MEVIRGKDSEARRGERFTGTAWVGTPLKAQRPAGMRVFLVFFEPGARTHWHAHGGEQTLYVVAGTGRVQKSGDPGREIGPGDIVYIAPGEKHWHGAGPQSSLLHLAVTTGGDTVWMEEVTEDAYTKDFN